MKYDIIIIGAGASGLIAAIVAARQGSSVLVIEKKDRAGKKILATGNGKCNFTNLVQTPECYRSEDSSFAMKVVSCFNVYQTIEFFKELGIHPKERDGYLYPNSEQASSIVSVLTMECERLKVQFRYHETVREIQKPYYTVLTEESTETDANQSGQHVYYSDQLLLAAGGCASPKLGSDGSGYKLAESLGHTILKPLPALVQLRSPDKYCKTVSGVRADAVVTVFSNNQKIAWEKGEILFTDYGVSGIPILQVSRFVSKALDKQEKVKLLLDLLPELSKKDLKAMLVSRINRNPYKNTEEMMVGLFHHKLSYIIITEAGLDPYKASIKLTAQEIELLTGRIKELNMNINATNSFENAQVCTGGVATAEINEASMESRLQNGLYLAGELVDVDGTCGGYNLQWAWSSGYLAGTSAGAKRDHL